MIQAKRSWLLVALFWVAIIASRAQTIDTLTFGNDASEKSHSLTTYFPTPTDPSQIYWRKDIPSPSDPSATPPSQVSVGALEQTSRCLLPRTPEGDAYGGQMTFSMAVDPTRQNYFTIKLWGSEPNGGNLLLNCNGREIGSRHGGGGLGEDPLYFAGPGWFLERFIYRTEPLPMSMTYRKTSVTITIRSLGGMFDYAPIFTYVPEYQHIMDSPSPSVYAAYTHAGSIVDGSGEKQGTAPAITTPRTLEDDDSAILRSETNVNSRLAHLLTATGSELSQGDALFLAQCYHAKTKCGATWIEYPSGKTEADLGNQIMTALDAIVMKYAEKPEVATAGWGGALGDMGNAIRLSWPVISGFMSARVPYGGHLGEITRQAAWSSALRASVDAGRFHRQNIANQSLFNATNIYLANRGLLLVDPANALKETEALRYIKEACGILPWSGDDLPGDGAVPTPGNPPYGPDWYMCTTKGTSKDGNGFVGSDYGEIGTWIYKLGLWSGDAQILARGIVMTKARDYFRYPGTDEKGYLIMQGADPIGVRNNDLPSHYVYLGRGFADDFIMASQGPGVIGKDLLGYFQEGMNDGQMARNVWDDPYIPGEYTAIKAMPPTNIKLPMAIGQPDFAWVDEENMVVTAKHGEERFFANLFWRQPGFINGLAKVFYLTPTIARLSDVMVDDVRFRSSGQTKITDTGVDGFTAPPDKPVAAFGNQRALVALRSDLAGPPPENRDGGRGTGYTFRYGNWLVGINADYKATYTLTLPSGVASATDLVSGQVKMGDVVLEPKTSVVFYLPGTASNNPPPARTLYIAAAGGNGIATVLWNPAGGADSYTLLRSTTSGGPYSTVATGITDCAYTDQTAKNGQTYYYIVASVNTSGTSGFSPEASASPVAPETATLAAPWSDVDIRSDGSTTSGSAKASTHTITVTSGPGGVGGKSDNCHFLYQPLAGDGTVTVQVQNQSSTNATAKAGIMIRSSVDAKSAEASIFVATAQGVPEFCYRGNAGSDSSHQVSGTANSTGGRSWARLTRSGNAVTGYVSPDDKTWLQIGTYTFADMPAVAYAGLVAVPGSYLPNQTNTVSFGDATLPLTASTLPIPPSTLTTVGGNTSATLNWSGDVGAAKYNIKRATSVSGPFTTVANDVTGCSYTDFGLSNGLTYYYAVSSVNALGESADCGAASLQPTQLPSTVTGLSVKGAHTKVTLSWLPQPGATSYVIRRATSLSGLFLRIASEITTPTYTDTGLKDGTLYYYQVAAVNGGGEGPPGVIGALPPGGVPDEWQTKDIGQSQPGGAYYTDETFTILGGDGDIWNTADSFRYVYQSITGDCQITARVNAVQNTSAWAKAGVMIRNSLDANSAFAATYVSSANGVSSQYRSSTGGSAAIQSTTAGLSAPYGVRILRQGSTFSFFSSPDGANWTPMGTTTISMKETVYIGVTVCSATAGVLNKATMDHVTVQQETPTK